MTPINGKTQLIGLIGWPVSHSFSPAMHNAAAQALGINWAYVPLQVAPDQVETAVSSLSALNFRGVNVTVPHKQAVMLLLDELDSSAKAIGAVNTIVVQANGRLTGHNTDWSGFLADLQAHNIPIAKRDCLILGAGGSARAVAYGLAHAGARVHILARRVAQVEAMIVDLRPYLPNASLSSHSLSHLPEIATSVSAPLIINCTPLGMMPNLKTSPWPVSLLIPANATVYDLVYNPRQTRLMQQAERAGCQAINGLGMLVQQGAKAFALWTGVEPDTAVMAAAISKYSVK
ncbi:Shikimate 5-dehydrogenase I alpha [hydrothermal vent metagenome]|uniref:shikimate dehydrogenase (NADP(+)) n=1 Tax=hydrothermal vent metagenome TaxID=652676 RepID=A0A3B0W5Z0_9ZZZZ